MKNYSTAKLYIAKINSQHKLSNTNSPPMHLLNTTDEYWYITLISIIAI
jgi:hypothetical protein